MSDDSCLIGKENNPMAVSGHLHCWQLLNKNEQLKKKTVTITIVSPDKLMWYIPTQSSILLLFSPFTKIYKLHRDNFMK